MAEYKSTNSSFHIFKPSPRLSKYIEFYYQGESESVDNVDGYARVEAIYLPLNAVEMALSYHGSSVRLNGSGKKHESFCSIIGTHSIQSNCFIDKITKVNKSVHVRFKPGGFYKIFGIYQSELKNIFYGFEDVFGNEGRLFEDRINNSKSLRQRIEITEEFILRQLHKKSKQPKNDITSAAVDLIENRGGSIKVNQIAGQLNISERTLRWEFLNRIGQSPKEYLETFRFRHILNEMLSRKSKVGNKGFNWADLALNYGYYDQAHFINEFKAATSITPDFFLKNEGKTFIKSVNFIIFLNKPSITSPALDSFKDDFVQIEKLGSFSR
ncbi:MAG: AraC family transcriptional regulator [Bacteroidota bacterium]